MARPNLNSVRDVLRIARAAQKNFLAQRALETSLDANSCAPAYGICTFAGHFKGSFFHQSPPVHGKENVCIRVFRALSLKRSFHATGTFGMAARDFYDILGISKDAGQGEIKKAYYALAKKHHPDVNKGDPDAEKKFQEIQCAYEVLKDDERRSLYDRVGHEGFTQAQAGGTPYGPGDFGFNDFGFNGFGINGAEMNEVLKNIFNQGSLGAEDVKAALELSFMEAVQGCTKNVSFQTNVACSSCDGSGVPAGTKPQTCRDCKGSGMIKRQQGAFRFETMCLVCGGRGSIVKEFCKTCRGNRVVRGQKKITLDVMAGVAMIIQSTNIHPVQLGHHIQGCFSIQNSKVQPRISSDKHLQGILDTAIVGRHPWEIDSMLGATFGEFLQGFQLACLFLAAFYEYGSSKLSQ